MTRRAPKAEGEVFKQSLNAYPKRSPNPRLEAWRVFDKLVSTGGGPEALIGAAGRFVFEWRTKGPDQMVLPHARTWRHQRRFDDYPALKGPRAATGTGTTPKLRRTPIDAHLNAAMTAFEQRALRLNVAIDGDRAILGARS